MNPQTETLNKLHNYLFGEVPPENKYSEIDFEKYNQDMIKIIESVPQFKHLIKTFPLSDLSVSDNKISPEIIKEKYLPLYIFLEILYDDIRNDPDAKDRLYSRINHIGYDNNFFGYLKIYTVYYSTLFTKKFDHWFPLRLFSSSFLMLNIIEAVVEDFLHGQFRNGIVGAYLAFSTPSSVNNFRKDQSENILCDFDIDWLNLYTSWNARFTYSDSPGKNYFPRTSICLLNSLHRPSEWLNNRAYVLFASHILKSNKSFNNEFGLNDEPNQAILSEWNNQNMNFIRNKIFGTRSEITE